MILTSEQQEAVIDLASTTRRVSRLHGYAGTGKTSAVATRVIREIRDLGETVQVLAPTGKAAKVLRSKGLHDAATIHSYLYAPMKAERPEWREKWDPIMADLRERGNLLPLGVQIDAATSEVNVDGAWAALIEAAPAKMRARLEKVQALQRFKLTFSAAGAINFYYENGYPASDVLVVDEASMVGETVAADLTDTGSRIIYIGDPAQLPPVGQRAANDAMREPHHLLTQVHRQKGGSRVLKLATQIRTSREPEAPRTKPSKLQRLEEYDQVLCWRNATRERVNTEVRRRLGRTSPLPEPGDRLICIKNTKPKNADERRWMNGEQVTVLGVAPTVHDDALELHLADDEGVEHTVISPTSTFSGHKAEQAYLDRAWGSTDPAFAYGYAVTVHKSQGSEWGSVLLIDESPDMIAMTTRREGASKSLEQARRWLYTAVTRASVKLDVVADLRHV